MERREFMGTVAASLLVAPRAAQAQRARKVPVVGILQIARVDLPNAPIEAFRKALRELGYVEGQTLTVEYRGAGGQPDALPGLAAELVRLKVDVLYAIAPAGVRAAREATNTIPIVALDLETDPVKRGSSRASRDPGEISPGHSLISPPSPASGCSCSGRRSPELAASPSCGIQPPARGRWPRRKPPRKASLWMFTSWSSTAPTTSIRRSEPR
jgi:ABC-type uncharacterized transport system, periplasmic component